MANNAQVTTRSSVRRSLIALMLRDFKKGLRVRSPAPNPNSNHFRENLYTLIKGCKLTKSGQHPVSLR